jgi:ATP sulfurylase
MFFFGNEDKDFIKTVSAFIGKKKVSTVLNHKYLSKRMVWPIRLAFYKNNKNKINPDYEISVELDESGVIYSYRIYYGDFEVNAILNNFNIIEKQKCR